MRAAALAVAAGFGVALLALAAFHTTTIGNCASGPVPYVIARPCPSNTFDWFGALAGSIALVVVVGAMIGGGLATVGAIFLAVGGACVAALATGAANASWVPASIVLAVLFLPLGGWMLWVSHPHIPLRVLVGLAPVAALGAVAALAAAVAIPGPIKERKQAAVAPVRKVAARDADSWFRAANLRRALGAARSQLGPSVRIASLDLKPAEAVIDAIRGGTLHGLYLSVGGSPQDYPSAATGDERTATVAAIDVQAPLRLLDELERRFHVAASRVEHIDFSLGVVTAQPEWDAYLKNSSVYYRAGGRGTGLQRCRSAGECAAPARATAPRPGSLFQATNLNRVLAVAIAKLGPSVRIADLAVYPDHASFVAVTGATAHGFSFSGGRGEENSTSSAAGRRSVAVEAIGTKAPARLLAELQRRFGLAAGGVAYIVFAPNVVTGEPQWDAHLASGSGYYRSGADGTGAQRFG